MRNILTFIFSMCFFCSFAQVKLSDTASNGTFSYHIGSNFKAQYPKGSCYLDRDASGSFAIRRVTGAVVTPYVSMANYELNGEVDTVLSSFIEKVNNIIMYSCASSEPTAKYIYGSPLYNQFNNIAVGNLDTLLSSSSGNTGISFCCTVFNPDFSFIFRGMKTKNDWAATNYYFASGFTYVNNSMPCSIDSIYDIVEVKNVSKNKISSFNVFVDGVAYDSLKTDIDCPSNISNLSHLKSLFVDRPLVANEFTLKSIVVTENSDTTIVQDNLFAISLWSENPLNLKRKNGIVIDSVVFNSDSSQVTITAYPVKTYDKTFVTGDGGGFVFAKVNNTTGSLGDNVIDSCQFVPSFGSSQSCTFDITEGKNTFAVSIKNSDEQIASVIFQISKN